MHPVAAFGVADEENARRGSPRGEAKVYGSAALSPKTLSQSERTQQSRELARRVAKELDSDRELTALRPNHSTPEGAPT